VKKVILIGYSGHALVVAEILMQKGYEIYGYLDKKESDNNLLKIPYLGFEREPGVLRRIKDIEVFPAIGDNQIRSEVMLFMHQQGFSIPLVISSVSSLSDSIKIGKGTLICRGVCINPFVEIGEGVIINTGSIIEHECFIQDFSHVAPGAVLAGNVKIGKGSFIGANAVIKQSVTIGNNVIIGAGAVILQDIEDNMVIAGNPGRQIHGKAIK